MPTTNIPLKCHIWKFHVQIWCNYFSIYATFELTAINNVTRNTGIHTLQIIGICPWTNMPTILHMYIPLYCYLSLHVDPTSSHTSQKNSKLQLLLYAIYLPPVQITWFALMGGMQIHMPYMNTGISHVTYTQTVPTPTIMPQSLCIIWVCHWPNKSKIGPMDLSLLAWWEGTLCYIQKKH